MLRYTAARAKGPTWVALRPLHGVGLARASLAVAAQHGNHAGSQAFGCDGIVHRNNAGRGSMSFTRQQVCPYRTESKLGGDGSKLRTIIHILGYLYWATHAPRFGRPKRSAARPMCPAGSPCDLREDADVVAISAGADQGSHLIEHCLLRSAGEL